MAHSHCTGGWEMKSLFRVVVCPSKYQVCLLRRISRMDIR